VADEVHRPHSRCDGAGGRDGGARPGLRAARDRVIEARRKAPVSQTGRVW